MERDIPMVDVVCIVLAVGALVVWVVAAVRPSWLPRRLRGWLDPPKNGPPDA